MTQHGRVKYGLPRICLDFKPELAQTIAKDSDSPQAHTKEDLSSPTRRRIEFQRSRSRTVPTACWRFWAIWRSASGGGVNSIHDAKQVIDNFRTHLDDGLGDRDALLELKSALFPVLAIFCGCTSVMTDYKSLTDSKPSVDKISKLCKAQHLQGKALKDGPESLAVGDTLASAVISGSMDRLAHAVESVLAAVPAWNAGGVM